MVTLRPKCKAKTQIEVNEKRRLKNICGNENEDLEVTNKWKEQVEKEQMERFERDHERDENGEANGKVRRREREQAPDEEDEAEEEKSAEEESDQEVEGQESAEQDSGDIRVMKKMLDPCLPTREEVEQHRLTHLPYRSWCPHCVKGRGVEKSHFRTERDQDAVGEMHLDYCFPSGAGIKPRNLHEKAAVVTGGMTVLVMRDRDTKMMLATVVPRKGTKGEFAARRSAAFCSEVGYSGASMIMRSDQEPAIVALVGDIALRRAPAKTIIEQSPVGSSQSNGIVERAIQSYEGLLRTLRGNLEERWDAVIPDGHAVWSWMSEYCAFLLNRFEVSADGKTAYERMKGKKAKQQGLEFAEGVLFKKKRVNQPKSESVWEDGVYLGVRGVSGELIIGTKEGVWKTRTVQRKPKEHRWCQSNVEMIGGVPWNTNGHTGDDEPDGDIPKQVIRLEPRKVEESEAEKIRESIEVPRSFSISRKDLDKHGFTSNCLGCRCAIRGTSRQAHTVECRERMKKAMSGEDKVKGANAREMEFHEKVYDDMRAKLKEKQESQVPRDEEEEGRDKKKLRKIAQNDEKGAGHDHLAKNDRIRGSKVVEDPEVGENLDSSKRRRMNLEAPESEDDSDIELGWVEFAVEVNGVEMLKEVNVERFIDEGHEIAVMEAFDDVTGMMLDVTKLREARNEEIKYIETRGIWERVPLQKCWDKLGRAPTSGKWVDVQKGEGVRSRYVGRDFKPKGEGPRAEIFASMPPLEAKKIIFSRAASQKGEARMKKLLFIDVKKAHMNAVCQEWAFVDLPEEIYEAGWCAQLKYWLYGMRPAARAWEEEYGGRLEKEGFRRGRSVPTVFYNESKGLSGAVHGDDFTFLGYDEDLDEMEELLKSWFELTVRGRLGPEDGDDKEIVILGRTVVWGPGGITIQADPKHAEAIKRYCGVDSSSKGLGNPGKKDENSDMFLSEVKVPLKDTPISDKARIREFRGMAATANYLGADRVDVQFGAKELCRSMAAPTEESFSKLKHFARYLVHVPEAVLYYENQRPVDEMVVFVDSDWAGCPGTRKSTSGGFVVLGKHIIKTWSSTQATRALSSGEAEFYAIIEGASRSLGVQALMDDLGFECKVRMKSDSSAGRAISLRKGTGKLRHLQVKYLWIQDALFEKRLTIDKVKGTDNPADVGTKFLMAHEIQAVTEKYGFIMKKREKV